MGLRNFQALKTFQLILDRNRGCNTPIEDFLCDLVERYGWLDDDGLGMTIEDIERKVDDLRKADLQGEIEHAHLMASRYPRPENNTEESTL
jgi:hypothetical protein